MKIALVQCPMFSVRMPQIGPAYLKSYLQKHGHQVLQFDFNIELYNSLDPEQRRYWEYSYDSKWDVLDKSIFDSGILSNQLLDSWAQRIIDTEADIIGFTVYYTSVKVSRFLARWIKGIDRQKMIIFGGPLVIGSVDLEKNTNRITDMNSLFDGSFANEVDIFVIGEGEQTLLEIAERLTNKQDLNDCKGIVVRKGWRLVHNGLRPLILNLDGLPFPDFSILDSHTYTDKIFLPILASRGCPNRCSFCDYPYLDRYKVRMRSAENVVDEIEYQKQKYLTELFHFNDSSINISSSFLSRMCELIIKRGISIRWGSSISIKRSMSKNLFIKMKKAGCEYLSFGIESAAPAVLKSMGKNFTVEDIRQNLMDCYQAGIAPCTNWIIGYPTETAPNFQQTLDFIKENKRYIMEMDANLCNIKPHSILYDNQKEFGIGLRQGDSFSWWTNDYSNTLEVRLNRLETFKRTFPELHTERTQKGWQDENCPGPVPGLWHR